MPPLHDDPVLAIAANDRAGVGAAADALASQATFSRLLDLLRREQDREVLEGSNPGRPAFAFAVRLAQLSTVQRHRRLHIALHGQRRRRI